MLVWFRWSFSGLLYWLMCGVVFAQPTTTTKSTPLQTIQHLLRSGKEAKQLKAISMAHGLKKADYLALVPSIKKALRASSQEVRISAWVFLLAKRLEHPLAIATAQRLLLHSSENIRQRAVRWLAGSGLTDTQLTPLMKQAIKDQHWLVRMSVLQLMRKRKGLTRVLTKEVLLTLEDKEAGVRWVASDLVGRWGELFWGALQKSWKTAKASTRPLLLSSLRLLFPRQKKALSLMVEALADKNKRVREAAALEIGRLGNKATPALKPLLKALQDKVAEVRVAAAWALGQMGAVVVRPVAMLLKNAKKSYVKIAAADALGHFQLELQPAIGILVKALDDKDWKVRRTVATTLFRGGARLAQRVSPALIPGIIKGLFEKQSWVNRVTAKILGWMGPRASAALPYLRKKLHHKDIRVRLAARQAIHAIVLP